METHLAALDAGGSTIIALAEGLMHFHVKRAFGGAFDPERVLVLSQFPPRETWNVGSAMTRNAVPHHSAKRRRGRGGRIGAPWSTALRPSSGPRPDRRC